MTNTIKDKPKYTPEGEQLIKDAESKGINPDAFRAYLNIMLEGYATLEDFGDKYAGEYINDEDFAQHMAEATTSIDFINQPWPLNCIDWGMAARELMRDYTSEENFYFRI